MYNLLPKIQKQDTAGITARGNETLPLQTKPTDWRIKLCRLAQLKPLQ